MADVEEVVGDHTEPDPALHAGLSFIAGAIQAMPAFEHTDAAFHPVRHFWAFLNRRFFCRC